VFAASPIYRSCVTSKDRIALKERKTNDLFIRQLKLLFSKTAFLMRELYHAISLLKFIFSSAKNISKRFPSAKFYNKVLSNFSN
jgi:hypothetical protein